MSKQETLYKRKRRSGTKFKRYTAKEIRDRYAAQAMHAVSGQSDRLIHLERIPGGVCARKDSGADVEVYTSGPSTVTNSAVAFHSGNVTCPRCKAYLKANTKERQRMASVQEIPS